MPKKWSDVIQSPEYQALDNQGKYEAQREYFQTVVAPQIPKEERGHALNEFYTKYPVPVDPTEGMGTVEKFRAGIGKGMTDLAQGAGQVLGIVPQEDVDESKRLDAPLSRTGAGKAGEITGKIAATVPAMFIPGVNTTLGAAAVGAGIGGLDPVATGESRTNNMIAGGLGGAGGQLLGRTLPKVTKAIIEPFTNKGQGRIAGRTLQEFAGENADDILRALENPDVLVPGSMPTTAEAATKAGGQAAGMAQLQRALQSSHLADELTPRKIRIHSQFATDLTERTLDQNAARLAAMQGVAKTPQELEEAIASRAAQGSDLYQKAFGQSVRVDPALQQLMSRPSMKAAVTKAAQIAEEEGHPLGNLFDQNGKFASVRGLHYVKMALDDMMDNGAQNGIGATEQRALMGTKSGLLNWMEQNVPEYNQARQAYTTASQPINQMQVGQEIMKRATGNQLPNVRGDMTLYPSAFGNAVKAGENVARKATGFRQGLEDVLTPEQMGTVNAVKDDLARTVATQNLGRAVGSNTAQNLASQNLLKTSLGSIGVPTSWAGSPFVRTLARPLQYAAQIGEEGILDKLAKALLDPSEAAALMQAAKGTPMASLLANVLGGTATIAGPQLLLNQQ